MASWLLIKQHRKKNGWQRHLPPPLVGAQTHSNNVVATDNNNPATEALDASQTTTRCSSSNVADEDGPRPTNAATATTTTLSSSSSASSLASLGAPPPTPPPPTTTVLTLEVRVPLNDCASESTTTTTTTTTTTSMSGTLWLPSHASKENKCHAFAICTPYGRRNLDTYGEVFGSRGYAMLIIEPRNRDRTNDDHFFDAESERRDMGRILMWIRSQEWHDKHICFLGGSMMGMQALAAAGAARQPHRYGNGLRGGKFAVVPVVSCNRLHTVMVWWNLVSERKTNYGMHSCVGSRRRVRFVVVNFPTPTYPYCTLSHYPPVRRGSLASRSKPQRLIDRLILGPIVALS